MKKLVLLFLIAFTSLNAQTGAKSQFFIDMDNSTQLSNTKHFYVCFGGTIFLAEAIDHIELFKGKEPHEGRNIIIAGLTMYAIGEAKERIHDKMMHRGVFSKADLFFNGWGATVGAVVKVCINDYRKRKLEESNYNFECRKHIMD